MPLYFQNGRTSLYTYAEARRPVQPTGVRFPRRGATPPLSRNRAISPITHFHSHIYHPPISRLHDLLAQPDPVSPTLEWIDPLRYSGSLSLLTKLCTKAPPQGGIHLQPCQFWASNGPGGYMEEGMVWEIIHIPTEERKAGTVWTRPWETSRYGHPRGGTTIKPHGGLLRSGSVQLRA